MAEPVVFRGRSDHLEMLISPVHDINAVNHALRVKIEANRRFFEGIRVSVVSWGALSDNERVELAGMLESDYSISLSYAPPQDAPADTAPEAASGSTGEAVQSAPQDGPASKPKAKSAAKSVKSRKSDATLFVQDTLRSGRRVEFDGDVVVLGDVNNGAEVIASGSIIIMGALRGLAHAGAQGDESALISAFSMRAKQFRIAAHIAISPEGEAETGLPEVARVAGDRIELVGYRTKA